MGIMKLRHLPRRLLFRLRGVPSVFIPEVIYPDDTFLVSFPKSGNTWVKFMLAHLTRPPEFHIDFRTVLQVIPEVNRDTVEIRQLARPRIMKSHAPYQPQFPKVIYVVRDGRDAYVSYYHYRRGQLPQDLTFAQYLTFENHWPCSWSAHVNSWLDADLDSSRFLLVQYEKLHRAPEEELARIASFVNLEVTKERIRRAVEQSAFATMQELEDTSGHPRSKRFSGRFVRCGEIGGWRDYFDAQATDVFKESENEALLRLGYEDEPDW